MCGKTYWPPANSSAANLVKFQQDCSPLWETHDITVMKFYDSYLKARTALPKLVDDSNYETETELGRGKRKGKRNTIYHTDSSDEGQPPLKRSKKSIPAPPPINVKSKITKGQTVLSKKEINKQKLEELNQRLKAAREAAAAKLDTTKVPSPKTVAGMTSPWNVSKLSKDSSKGNANSNQNRIGSKTTGNDTTPRSNLSRSNSDDFMCSTPIPGSDSHQSESISKSSPILGLTRRRPNNSSFQPLDARILPGSSSSGSKTHVVHEDYDENDADGGSLDSPTVPSISPPISPITKSNTNKEKDSISGVLGPVNQNRCCCKDLQIVVKRNTVTLKEVSGKCDLILMNLGRVSRSLLPNEKRITPPPNMPTLPLSSEADLKTYESFLKKSDINLAGVCDYMSTHIKTNATDPERKSANKILAHLLTNSLAQNMNLEGGNGKIAFRTLQLYKVFLGTLQAAFKESDLNVAEDALGRWLKDAKNRKQ